jgi:HSP20 family protein
MSLTRYQTPQLSNWTPFDRLFSLRDEMDRLFDFTFPSRDSGLFSGWSPALDLWDDKDSFVAKVELPGMKKEDINISLHEGVLTVSGERKHEHESGSKEGGAFRSERYFGKFQRSVTLPTRVDPANVKASYKDGVLTVFLPKAEEAKPRHIDVTVS